jgi:signal transduction histidine kinase
MELLHGVRDDLAALASEREVSFELLGMQAGVWLDGDPGQLRDAVRAVIRNAIEATPAGGWTRVEFATEDDGCDVTITVTDNGTGLSAHDVEHAFDPFYSGRSAGRGRGLGLSTAWQLARQNGGNLSFANCQESQTRMVLTLRRAVGQEILALRSA